MKILPVEAHTLKDTDTLIVDKVTVEYISYDGDCIDSEPQILTLTTENNGVARFIVMESKRFAISGIADLIDILEDFDKRAGIVR